MLEGIGVDFITLGRLRDGIRRPGHISGKGHKGKVDILRPGQDHDNVRGKGFVVTQRIRLPVRSVFERDGGGARFWCSL